MHVLLTNDDGPLDDRGCPYMKYLVDEINENTDWDLSIVVPNQQRSWIGKAHFAEKTVNTSYIYTEHSTATDNAGTNQYKGPYTSQQDLGSSFQEWCLLDSTPAACADIGIHHLYTEASSKNKPIDLVISGPNFGKNSGNLYVLTSGTVGAALEAVTHNVKAIALSYSFENLDHDYTILKEAAKISRKLITKLYKQLQVEKDIDLYSINIPLIPSLKLGKTEIHYAPILKNTWQSIYAPIKNEDGEQAFKWQPDFKTVHKESLKDFNHSDARVLLDKGISVTPLQAAFHSVEPSSGVITLDEDEEGNDSVTKSDVVDDFSKLELSEVSSILLITIPEDSYIYQPIIDGFKRLNFKITNDIRILEKINEINCKIFHYCDYEDIDIDLVNHDKYFVPSYIFRKALIRKHYLANTVLHYVTKNPQSVLKKAIPETYQLEVDYAEFLEDSLDEAYELRQSIEEGGYTWILKPSMSDKGQGIRIFQSIEQLQDIFDSFEEDDTDDEGGDDDNGVIISQLRHFVVQKYIDNPLILEQYQNKKFHLRVYTLCVGDLEVYVYKNILTLFAGSEYRKVQETDESIDMEGHLTNTCLQEGEVLVVPFWELKGVEAESKEKIFNGIKNITGEIFNAARSVDKMNFQPLANGIEVYGVDFLVDEEYDVTLLEINSYPDFKQTGRELKAVIAELFDEVAGKVDGLLSPDSPRSEPISSLYRVM